MIQTEQIPVLPVADVKVDGKDALDAFKGLSLDDAITKLANSLVDFGFKLMIAILVLYLGKWIIAKLYRSVRRIMINRRIDASLTTFTLSLIRMILYFILIITIIGILGIETSSFLALFASAGVAIGMALSGTLQNFAGGVLILLLKPYKVGDYIEAQGYSGTVKAIQIFHTVINTIDNKAIIIPNGGLSTSSINNYSLESYRRVDWTIGLCYGVDADKAKTLILEILRSDDRVVKSTVEEDMAYRRLLHANPESESGDCKSDDNNCKEKATSEKKLGWWQRMRIRRRKHDMEEEMHLQEMASENAGMPMNVNREPFVAISELAESSVNFTVRAWTQSSTYWPLYFEMNERFYRELLAAGFEFPFPQLDVHFPEHVGIHQE